MNISSQLPGKLQGGLYLPQESIFFNLSNFLKLLCISWFKNEQVEEIQEYSMSVEGQLSVFNILATELKHDFTFTFGFAVDLWL